MKNTTHKQLNKDNITILNEEDELIFTVKNFKLHSKKFKYGYYNVNSRRSSLQPDELEDKGIFLYNPQEVRNELSCFYLEQIIIRKPANDAVQGWFNRLLLSTDLIFNTEENDKLIFSLHNISNIRQFHDENFYLFNTQLDRKYNNTCYYLQEFITLLIHELYHSYNSLLYEFTTGRDRYDIRVLNSWDEKNHTVIVDVIDNKTDKMVTGGYIELFIDDEHIQTDEVEELWSTEYTIRRCDEDPVIKLVYTDEDEHTTTKEYTLSTRQTVEVNVNDVTGHPGETVTLNADVTDETGNPIDEGIINFNIELEGE